MGKAASSSERDYLVETVKSMTGALVYITSLPKDSPAATHAVNAAQDALNDLKELCELQKRMDTETKCATCNRVPIFDTVQECGTPDCSNDVCCHCDGGRGLCGECRGGEVVKVMKGCSVGKTTVLDIDQVSNNTEVEGVDFSKLAVKRTTNKAGD